MRKKKLWSFSSLLGIGLLGCGQDCRELARMADFELSQGNKPNAIVLYQRALKADANCPDVAEKLERAQKMR